jgi:hypothetical protein
MSRRIAPCSDDRLQIEIKPRAVHITRALSDEVVGTSALIAIAVTDSAIRNVSQVASKQFCSDAESIHIGSIRGIVGVNTEYTLPVCLRPPDVVLIVA